MIDRQRLAPLPLRIMFGIAFMYHGFPKLFSMAGHAGFANSLKNIGIPLPEFMAWVVGIVEFFGGIALILGLFVVVVSLLLIIDMLVALFAVHISNGFGFLNIIGTGPTGPVYGAPGVEVNLVYIAGFLTLMLTGAGLWSLDGLIFKKRNAVKKSDLNAPSR